MRKIKEKDKTLSLLEKKNFDETKENFFNNNIFIIIFIKY